MLNFIDFSIRTATDSSTTKRFYPDYQITEDNNFQLNQSYALAGNHNIHRVKGGNYRYTIPFTYISSEDAKVLNDYWSDRTDIVITFNNSGTPWGINGSIINVDKPFKENAEMSVTHKKGFLRVAQLENNDKFQGYPFELDDADFGVLNENYVI